MKPIRQTIHEVMSKWGQSQRQLPPNNDALKSEILSSAPSRSSVPMQTPVHTRRNIPWLALSFTTIAVITIFINPANFYPPIARDLGYYSGSSEDGGLSAPGYDYAVPNQSLKGSSGSSPEYTGLPIIDERYYPYPQPTNEIPINDNRQFIKTDYSASLRTRDVSDVVQKIQIAVKGVDGRVDSVNSSTRYGYVSFVIPASQLESLKMQIKGFTWAKLYTENISSQNLLSQKISIEEQQAQYRTTINNLKTEKNKLVTAHQNKIAGLNSQLNAITTELNNIETQLMVVTDPVTREQLLIRRTQLLANKDQAQKAIVSENNNYAGRLESYNGQIKSYELSLENINKQDQKLLDTVATVRGTISINWISVNNIIEIYTHINIATIIFIIAAIIAYIIYRQRSKRYLNLAI